MDLETVKTVLGDDYGRQLTQYSIMFMVAAWFHAGTVKKEISAQVANIVKSIDSVAKALKDELAAQGSRIENIENGVNKLSGRVDVLEKKEQK